MDFQGIRVCKSSFKSMITTKICPKPISLVANKVIVSFLFLSWLAVHLSVPSQQLLIHPLHNEKVEWVLVSTTCDQNQNQIKNIPGNRNNMFKMWSIGALICSFKITDATSTPHNGFT